MKAENSEAVRWADFCGLQFLLPRGITHCQTRDMLVIVMLNKESAEVIVTLKFLGCEYK
jgi:hypothetical protein